MTKKLPKRVINLITCIIVILSVLISAFGSLLIGFALADSLECWRPDYAEIDLSAILSKSELTDEDYAELYRQTGLTKIGVDRMLARGEAGRQRITAIQSGYFKEREVKHSVFGFLLCTDYVDESMPAAYLENGDILVTSSTHFSSWRLGHAGIVTNADRNEVLQSGVAGELSSIDRLTDFTDRINFMILTPKVGKEVKQQVADYAAKNLTGKKFSALTGIFTDKNKSDYTHCSHLVWYAYKQFGIDLDSNGGGLVTSQDIFKSPEVEVVQVFGFDPKRLWY
ncbi:MAG TPA: hypothetical protein DD415_02900 [Clostridiales bacterium]|nr:hypothetical protein [Clostridiales bacterium]